MCKYALTCWSRWELIFITTVGVVVRISISEVGNGGSNPLSANNYVMKQIVSLLSSFNTDAD
jgi:hypothetical protein